MGAPQGHKGSDLHFWLVEAMGIEPTDLLHAMQALYQLSYAPEVNPRLAVYWLRPAGPGGGACTDGSARVSAAEGERDRRG
jgi:hypothetical protein